MKVPKRLKPYTHVTLLQIIKMFTSISKLHYSLIRAKKNMLIKYEMISISFFSTTKTILTRAKSSRGG